MPETCLEPPLPFPSFDATLGYPGEGPATLERCFQTRGVRMPFQCFGATLGYPGEGPTGQVLSRQGCCVSLQEGSRPSTGFSLRCRAASSLAPLVGP